MPFKKTNSSFEKNFLLEYWLLLVKGNINRNIERHCLDDVPEFKNYYQDQVATHVDTFEQDRIKALSNLRLRSLLAGGIVAVLVCANIISFAVNARKDAEGIAFFSIAGIVILSWWVWQPARNYTHSIKAVIFPIIFRYFGSDFIFRQVSPVTVASLKPSMIIPSYEKESTEDYIKGKYNGVVIELFEAELRNEKRRGLLNSPGRRREVKFDGLILRLSMNKEFTSKTIVTKDYGDVGNWIVDKFKNLTPVRLEDPVFEKEFEVYSDDQTEARYILSPVFMEQLLKLKAYFEGYEMQCSFYDNNMLLMISCKQNRFEPLSLFHPATFTTDIKMILSEMQAIFKIVDILQLKQQTRL